MLRRANKLQGALDDWVQSEERLVKRNNTKGAKLAMEDEARCEDIFAEKLTEKDWRVLLEYEKLLRPCYEATMDLQGHPGDGKSSGLSNVIQDIEYILEELTAAYETNDLDTADAVTGEWHFKLQIKLAIDKAQQYYQKLENSTAYLAAVILDPAKNWDYIETFWDKQPKWIKNGQKAVKNLWLNSYKQHPVSEALSPQKKKQRNRQLTGIEAYRMRGIKLLQTPTREKIKDEYDRYCAQGQVQCDEPIAWWIAVGRVHYPHLAQMAIDILSIPAMSDEPERIFSRLGLMITDRRNGLQCNTVQAAQCLYSWDKAGVINLRNKPVN